MILALVACIGLIFAATVVSVFCFYSRRNRALRVQLEAAAADLQHLQEACSRLAPAGVVDQLIANGMLADAMAAAERKVATAMFVDLVGFTELSERLEPAVLVRILNGYYQCMSDAIHDHGGQVGCYIGDGIVAYFGALQPNPWQCGDAVHAALAMREAIRTYNMELHREGLPGLSIGIGIHRGSGLAGLVGSRERREFSFIGSAVNLAARVQSLTRLHQVDILVTDALRAELDTNFALIPMAATHVKGFADPVVTYAVKGVNTHDRQDP